MGDTFDLSTIRQRLLSETPDALAEGFRLPVAAVAIIIDPKRDKGSVLLIRRVERAGDPWSGQVAFPGGRKSHADDSVLETAIRETSEEVGIRLSEHEDLGALPPLPTRILRIVVAPVVFLLRNDVTVRLNNEVKEVFWVPLQFLQGVEPEQNEVKVDSRKMIVDSYVYEGRVVWGLTYRIINMLLGRTNSENP